MLIPVPLLRLSEPSTVVVATSEGDEAPEAKTVQRCAAAMPTHVSSISVPISQVPRITQTP